MMTFGPRLDVLPAAQRRLWAELASIPREFVLYGGTGLALRLGHRTSVDFDFFAAKPLDHGALRASVPWLTNTEVLQEEANALTVSVDRGDPIKVSFFGGISFGHIDDPDGANDHGLHVASLIDLAGTKIKALLQRVEAKDYLDIAALLQAGVSLGRILGAARALFGAAFNPLAAQKSLCYFEGGDLATLDARTRQLLIDHAARDVSVIDSVTRRGLTAS